MSKDTVAEVHSDVGHKVDPAVKKAAEQANLAAQSHHSKHEPKHDSHQHQDHKAHHHDGAHK